MSTGVFCEHLFQIQNQSQNYPWTLSLEFPILETLATFAADLSKLHSTCPEDFFEDQSFLLQVVFLHACFRNSGEKISELWITFDLKGRQKSILYAQRRFATKIVFLRKIDFYRIDFGVWPAIFLTLGERTWKGCQKSTLRVLINFEEKQLFSQNQFWYIFFGP